MPRIEITTMSREEMTDAAWKRAAPMLFLIGMTLFGFTCIMAGATIQARDTHYATRAGV